MSLFSGRPRPNISAVSLQKGADLQELSQLACQTQRAQRSVRLPLLLLGNRWLLPGPRWCTRFLTGWGRGRGPYLFVGEVFCFLLFPKFQNHVLCSLSCPLPHSPQFFHEYSFLLPLKLAFLGEPGCTDDPNIQQNKGAELNCFTCKCP